MKNSDDIVTYNFDLSKPYKLSEEEKILLEEAEKTPITFDEDCPELTKEDIARCKRIINIKREERKKETVSLRLSAKTLAKAKSLGKGYTTVLAKILEQTINDEDLLTLASKYF